MNYFRKLNCRIGGVKGNEHEVARIFCKGENEKGWPETAAPVQKIELNGSLNCTAIKDKSLIEEEVFLRWLK